MDFWLRAVLTWVLAVALPLQGVAAATMLACGQDGPPAAEARALATAAAADVSTMSTHAHHHHDSSTAETSQDTGRHAAATKARCSICASCCVATALPAAILAFDTTAPVEIFARTLTRVAPVFLTGGPERPPRPSIG